jgi:hypothetical protein
MGECDEGGDAKWEIGDERWKVSDWERKRNIVWDSKTNFFSNKQKRRKLWEKTTLKEIGKLVCVVYANEGHQNEKRKGKERKGKERKGKERKGNRERARR